MPSIANTDSLTELRQCRRCLLLQAGDTVNYDLIQEHISRLSPDEKAGDEQYRQRLTMCSSCDELIDGTCLKCGCYVEFRAAFKKQHCPDMRRRYW